jgi:hypothetical protein
MKMRIPCIYSIYNLRIHDYTSVIGARRHAMSKKRIIARGAHLVICSGRRQHHTRMYCAAPVDYSLRRIAFPALWLEPRRVHVVVGPRNLAGCEQILSRRDEGLWIAQRCDRAVAAERQQVAGALEELPTPPSRTRRLDCKLRLRLSSSRHARKPKKAARQDHGAAGQPHRRGSQG